MPDEECFREMGAFEARLDHLEEENKQLRKDVAELQQERAKLAGIGGLISLIFAAVGFMFADVIKSWGSKLFQ